MGKIYILQSCLDSIVQINRACPIYLYRQSISANLYIVEWQISSSAKVMPLAVIFLHPAECAPLRGED